MESVGEFEFNRKDLIGHGSFAVVFKGRHKEKPDMEVAVKCISKKNLAKSQSLLDKEIGILKELQHDNIVRLLDCQKRRGCVYLIMEYCNGGDLAEYLHTQGSLSEDTIRIFLQQIAKAMKVLQSKGIIHRDLKPQNILLCHRKGRRSRPKNMCIKIADFGFARHLQTNMMAATLCGSPLYMAPEVIMSQHYDAKADLWSIGTIVYQCLTGEAPFHALTPQKLRMFYESSSNLLPRIPRETSRELKNLLRKLLQKNQKDRIGFEEFFQHPFLETISPTKKYSPVPAYQFPSSASGDSSSSSHTSSLAFPQHSDGDLNQPPKGSASPAQDTPVSSHGMNHMAYSHSGDAESFSDEYVILHVPCSRVNTCEVEATSHNTGSQMYSRCLPLAEKSADTAEKTPPPSPLLHTPSKPESNKPVEFVGRNWSEAVPIPVPTQIQNYQHIEQNLQSVSLQSPTRASPCCADGSSASSPRCGRCRALRLPFNSPRLTTGGARPQRSSPTVGISPKTLEQTILLSTKTGQLADSPDMLDLSRPQVQSRPLNRTRTTSDLQSLVPFRSPQHNLRRDTANKKGPFKRSLSTGMLSNMLRKAAFGAKLFEKGSDESLYSEKSMDTAAPPTGCHRGFQLSPSPPPVVFTMGSPPNLDPPLLLSAGSPSYINSPGILGCRLLQCGSRRNSETEAMGAFPNSGLVFHPPELPEDTVMEQAHTTGLTELRFTLAFVHCIMELASSKDQGACVVSSPDVSLLEQSLVTDQISLLNREWSYTEQLVLYMKAEECLSSALRTAKDSIKQGQLFPSDTVKREVRELNELYKKCVTHCRSLNHQLQTFLLNKQRLMDRFMGITAEKLLYSHAVHMVQSAALDEMFHNDTTSVQRYHKALLLMEGLSRIITEEKDVESIDKCKQSIEQRLAALQTST